MIHDGLKFTDDNGNIIVVEPEEYEPNIGKGYRSLVGIVLWPLTRLGAVY